MKLIALIIADPVTITKNYFSHQTYDSSRAASINYSPKIKYTFKTCAPLGIA